MVARRSARPVLHALDGAGRLGADRALLGLGAARSERQLSRTRSRCRRGRRRSDAGLVAGPRSAGTGCPGSRGQGRWWDADGRIRRVAVAAGRRLRGRPRGGRRGRRRTPQAALGGPRLCLSRQEELHVPDVRWIRGDLGVAGSDEGEVDEEPARRAPSVLDPDVAEEATIAVGLTDVPLEDDLPASDEGGVRGRCLGAHPLDGPGGVDRLRSVDPDVPDPLRPTTPVDVDRVTVDDPEDGRPLRRPKGCCSKDGLGGGRGRW